MHFFHHESVLPIGLSSSSSRFDARLNQFVETVAKYGMLLMLLFCAGTVSAQSAQLNVSTRSTGGGVTFQPQKVGAVGSAVTIEVTFDVPGNLGSANVLTQGEAGLDFVDSQTGTCKPNTHYSAGDSCTIGVHFVPQSAGTRYGAAVLKDTSGNVMATRYMEGVGIGPQVSFTPGTESKVVGSGLLSPGSIAADSKGNTYILDENNTRLVKAMPPSAGTAPGVLATNLSRATAVAVDGAGSLFVAVEADGAVLKTTQTVKGYLQTTIAKGLGSPAGIAIDGNGAVYVADQAEGRIIKLSPAGANYTQDTVVSGIKNVQAIAVDGLGNLYLANPESPVVYKESPGTSGYSRSTISISSKASPQSIAADGFGNLYIVDGNSNTVLKEAQTSEGYVESTAVSDLKQTTGRIGIAVDGSGDLYLSNPSANSVTKVVFSQPPALSFSVSSSGMTSADNPQTVTVQNIGNSDLIFPIPSSGTNPSVASNFSVDSNAPNACPMVGSAYSSPEKLAAGATCSLAISFSPTHGGRQSGSIVLTDNSLNLAGNAYTQQTILLNADSAPGSATLTSPAPGTVLTGSSVSFMWSAGTGATAYQLWLGTGVGSYHYYSSGQITALSASVTGLPTGGQTIYARLWSLVSGTWVYNDYTYTASGTPAAAVLTSPAPGSVFSGSAVTFTWTAGNGASLYNLWLGSGVGSYRYYSSGETTSLTASATGLPTGAQTIYARLWSLVNGTWEFNDYTYTATGTASLSVLTAPAPGSTLSGTTATFNWTPGNGVFAYNLWVGTGVGSYQFYSSGQTNALSAMVSGLPSTGQTIYVRLWSLVNSTWKYNDYTLTAYTAPSPAVMKTPVPGTQFSGSTVTFTWTAGYKASGYNLWLGSGVGSSRYFSSGQGTGLSATATGLPTSGQKIYARLWSYVNSTWEYNDYTYIAAGTPVLAALTSPTPGTQFTGSSVTFTWTAGTDVTAYNLILGSGPGSSRYFSSGQTTSLTTTATGLPTAGQTIYARLWSLVNGTWQYTDYTFTAF